MRIHGGLVAVAIASIIGAGTIGVAVAQSTPENDLDCSDFQYQEDAQQYFNDSGYSADNDPERLDTLDGVGDGVACEALPNRPVDNVPPDSDGDITERENDIVPSGPPKDQE